MLSGSKDGSLFMRPFAFGATAYLLTINLLHLITHGQFQLPDRWAEVYTVILSARFICMQVMALFFGSYALRQYRKATVSRLEAGERPSAAEARQVADFLAKTGPSTPKVISDGTQIPRRTLTRVLADMVEDGGLIREGSSPKSPSTTYRSKND